VADQETTIPVHNARIEPARDERSRIIGVEIRCLFTHDQISELPEMFVESAHRVLDEAARKAKHSFQESRTSSSEHTTKLDDLADKLRHAAFPGAGSWRMAAEQTKEQWRRVAQYAEGRIERARDEAYRNARRRFEN
jgi:hypothetical protein